jgi:sulfur-oxidizing protein SoxY
MTNTALPLARRHLLAGTALLPLARCAAARVVVEPALAQALAGLGLAADKVVWASPLQLTAPAVAEDGAAVQVALRLPLSLPVAQLHLFAPGNRRALVATLTPGAELAWPEWTLRIRMARTQTLAAVAQLADGRVLGAQAEVRITAGGGCGS